VRLVAVSDVDAKRMEEGKQYVEQWYAENRGSATWVDVRMYQDYRELLDQPDIDAVVISTPDHQHFLPTLQAAIAGKHVYLQKPFSLTLEEGRILSDTLQRLGTVFQVGSQQRSMTPWPHFKRACELVRNGRIGSLDTVRVGLPGDPPGGDPTPMPVPDFLDYDMWLGTTPVVPYTVDRVHPLDRIGSRNILRSGYGRPGWLRCEQFSAGMITGWGAHHVDTAHWGMGAERTGPVEIEAEADFATGGLWDVHGDFRVEAKYADGITMLISGEFPNGVRFEGEDGWIFVTRGGAQVTSSDPDSRDQEAPLQASDPTILQSDIGPDEIRLYESEEHHTNWIECIQSGKTTVAPVEVAHRSTSACLIAHIAMKLPRKLYWDPDTERFADDEEANAMLSRSQRHPYTVDMVEGLPEG
jgi:predicted dehydrogenase